MATEASRVLADSDPEYLVALAAAVLGGGAFIVAILQALLQYLNSNNLQMEVHQVRHWLCEQAR